MKFENKINLVRNFILLENFYDDESLNSTSNRLIINDLIDDDDEFEKIDVADVEKLNDDELLKVLKLICTINYFKGSINENIYENLIVELIKRFNKKYLLYLNLCCLKYDIFILSNFKFINKITNNNYSLIALNEIDDIKKVYYIIDEYDEFDDPEKFNKIFNNLMYLSNYQITNFILYDYLLLDLNESIEYYFNIDEFIDDHDEFHVINNNYNEIIYDYNEL